MIHVGLIGFGFAGKVFHAPVIREVEGLKLSAILQRSGSDAANAFPDVPVVRSLEELMAMKEIRLAVIATPNPSHFEIARRCLMHGLDVVIDKPMATSSEEIRTLAKLAKEQGRTLSVYQNRRWDGDFIALRKLLAGGSLGRIVEYESHFDRYRPEARPEAWRERDEPGSGILFDLGPHLIDQALVLFGIPEAVSGDIRRERDEAGVDDAFDVVLHYPRLRARLCASMLAKTPGPRFLVRGTLGTFVKYGLDPQEEKLKAGASMRGEDWGVEEPQHWGTLYVADGEGDWVRALPTERGDYRLFYENVRDAILGRAPLAVAPEDALRGMIALELARESSATGRVMAWPKA